MLNIVVWVALAIAIAALAVGIVSLAVKRNTVKREIVVKDEALEVRDGIMHAKGFSNERFKKNGGSVVIAKDKVTAEAITDGHSEMRDGRLRVKKDVVCKQLSDGVLELSEGNLTTTGELVADTIRANRKLSAPASGFGEIQVLEMETIAFPADSEKDTATRWQPIAHTTKRQQIFSRPGMTNGMSICNDNALKFHMCGLWEYSVCFEVEASESARVAIGIGAEKSKPEMCAGIARGDQVAGSGMLCVQDDHVPYQFSMKHVESPPKSCEASLRVRSGRATFRYLGRYR